MELPSMLEKIIMWQRGEKLIKEIEERICGGGIEKEMGGGREKQFTQINV